MTITLTIGSIFVTTFSNMFYVGYFLRVSNFGVMAYNRFVKKGVEVCVNGGGNYHD
jgi:hypothetical protein